MQIKTKYNIYLTLLFVKSLDYMQINQNDKININEKSELKQFVLNRNWKLFDIIPNANDRILAKSYS